VDSTGQIHLYMDRPNGTPIYYVMIGGVVRHRGKLKHCRAMFNTYSNWYQSGNKGKARRRLPKHRHPGHGVKLPATS